MVCGIPGSATMAGRCHYVRGSLGADRDGVGAPQERSTVDGPPEDEADERSSKGVREIPLRHDPDDSARGVDDG